MCVLIYDLDGWKAVITGCRFNRTSVGVVSGDVFSQS